MSMPIIDPNLSPPPSAIQSSGKAKWSLGLGLASLICLFFTGLPAILTGLLAVREIGRSRGRLTGSGLAFGGMAAGFVGCLLGALAVIQVYYAWSMVNQQQLSQYHLRQIGIGIHNYHDTELSLPLAGSEHPTLGLNMSWRVRLLPFIEQRPLHDVVKYDQPWDGEANAPLLRRMPRTYAIPPATGGTETSYLVFTAPEPIQAGNLQGTPMFGNGTGRGYGTADFSSVIDGTGNTIMIVEADRDRSVPWMKPADLPVDPANPKAGLGHARPGGFNVVMGDGSVRFIPNTIENDTLLKLILRNDGYAVSY